MAPPGRHRRSRLLAVAVAVVVWLPLGQPATATPTDVPTALEAWFRTSPVGGPDDPLCAMPVGCPVAPVPPAPPYPEDTLHVGATAGRSDAVTYVAFDTASLPDGATLTGGTARFPVASSEDGTLAPDTARLLACVVTEPFEPARGDRPDAAPEPRCDLAAEATYVADDDLPRFEVDLATFVAAWEPPGAVAGLALVPSPEDPGTWHVAFSAREREQDGAAPPISAAVDYTVTTTEDRSSSGFGDSSFGGGSTTLPRSSSPPTSSSGGFVSRPSAPAPPVVSDADGGRAEAPPVVAPPSVEGEPVAAPVLPAGYAYPVAWLLPLALALGGTLLTRSLTREVEVLDDDAQRDLVGRLWLAFFPDQAPTARR